MILVWLLITFIAAALGALASTNAATFYAQLMRPEWAPPAWIFGPVWSALYLLMGIAACLVWRLRRVRATSAALTLYVLQLGANALWSWLFFAWHHGAWAFADIVVLWVLIVATWVAFRRVQPVAPWLLAPYLLWVSFAAALNFTIWRLNPSLLS